MKVGDYVHCYKTGYMNDGQIFAIAGKDYLVTDVLANAIQITSELGLNHRWELNELFDEYFRYIEPKKGYQKWADSKIVFKFV